MRTTVQSEHYGTAEKRKALQDKALPSMASWNRSRHCQGFFRGFLSLDKPCLGSLCCPCRALLNGFLSVNAELLLWFSELAKYKFEGSQACHNYLYKHNHLHVETVPGNSGLTSFAT